MKKVEHMAAQIGAVLLATTVLATGAGATDLDDATKETQIQTMALTAVVTKNEPSQMITIPAGDGQIVEMFDIEVDESQTDGSQTDESQTEEPQTDEPQTDEPQTEEPQADTSEDPVDDPAPLFLDDNSEET